MVTTIECPRLMNCGKLMHHGIRMAWVETKTQYRLSWVHHHHNGETKEKKTTKSYKPEPQTSLFGQMSSIVHNGQPPGDDELQMPLTSTSTSREKPTRGVLQLISSTWESSHASYCHSSHHTLTWPLGRTYDDVSIEQIHESWCLLLCKTKPWCLKEIGP
jgi:hypothetical protein